MTKLKSLPNFPRKKERNNPIAENVYNNGEVYGYNKCLSEVGELECPRVPSELIKAFQEYIVLLGKELDEVVPMASVHGWKSSRFEEGKKIREKIHNLITKRRGGE